MWLSAGSGNLSSATGLLGFCNNMFVLVTHLQWTAAILTSCLSVRTMEWAFLPILTVFNKIKLVSNKSESMGHTRTWKEVCSLAQCPTVKNKNSLHCISLFCYSFLSLNIPRIHDKGLLQCRPQMDGPFHGCGSPILPLHRPTHLKVHQLAFAEPTAALESYFTTSS